MDVLLKQTAPGAAMPCKDPHSRAVALPVSARRIVWAPVTLCCARADADMALGEQQGKPEPITAAMSCMDALFDLCQVSFLLLTCTNT